VKARLLALLLATVVVSQSRFLRASRHGPVEVPAPGRQRLPACASAEPRWQHLPAVWCGQSVAIGRGGSGGGVFGAQLRQLSVSKDELVVLASDFGGSRGSCCWAGATGRCFSRAAIGARVARRPTSAAASGRSIARSISPTPARGACHTAMRHRATATGEAHKAHLLIGVDADRPPNDVRRSSTRVSLAPACTIVPGCVPAEYRSAARPLEAAHRDAAQPRSSAPR